MNGSLADDYRSAFDADWTLESLSRQGLARLGREVMLLSMLHDRSLMPHVATRGGSAASVAQADDEWMAASPIYTARNRANLGIKGNTAGDVLKAFQFDIGTPHHFLDMRGEIIDDELAYFWLDYCGAHDYVRWVSGNDAGVVSMMCHQMEDNTFDATLKVTNPRARAVAVHRPPKPDAFGGEHCRWEVRVVDGATEPRPDNPNLDVMWATKAAQFSFALGRDSEAGGLSNYEGPYIPGLRLEDLSHAVLVRQVKEFALDVHLLMRAAYLSMRQRHGSTALSAASPEHIEALAPAFVARLRAAMRIEGDGLDAIAKVMQLNPLLPFDYVARRVELSEDEVCVTIEHCIGLRDRSVPSPLDQLDDDEPALLLAFARSVNPRAVIAPAPGGTAAWILRVDEHAEPAAPHPLAEIVGGHNLANADLAAREVPVMLRSR